MSDNSIIEAIRNIDGPATARDVLIRLGVTADTQSIIGMWGTLADMAEDNKITRHNYDTFSPVRVFDQNPCRDIPADPGNLPDTPDGGRTIARVHAVLEEAKVRAKSARDKFGPHRSAEFACCRIMEEADELAQAATATSKGRDMNRRGRILDEAIDTIAMVIRLLEEYPDGMK